MHHARDACRPGASGVDCFACGHKTACGLDAGNALRVELNVRDLGVLPQLDSVVDGPAHKAVHGAVGIDEAVGRAEAATHNVVGAELREHAANFVGGDQADVL